MRSNHDVDVDDLVSSIKDRLSWVLGCQEQILRFICTLRCVVPAVIHKGRTSCQDTGYAHTAAMANGTLLPTSYGPTSVPAFRHWIHGFTLQTLVYGINVVLFLMSIWVLTIHILKASHTRFHKHHLFQNYILLVYTTVMFALSSIFMGHQGIVAGDAWDKIFQGESPEKMVWDLFHDRVPLRRACSAVLILINWGTVSILVSSINDSSLRHSLTHSA